MKYIFFAITASLLFANPAHAASEGSLDIMAQNVLNDLGGADGPFIKLFWAFCVLSGLLLVMRGIYNLVQREGITGGIITIMIGALIIAIPQTIGMFNQTIFNDVGATSILSDKVNSGAISAEAKVFMNLAVFGVQVVGFISLYRGLRSFSDVALSTNKHMPAEIRQGWIFTIAGILCINIVWTLKLCAGTLGGEVLNMYNKIFNM